MPARQESCCFTGHRQIAPADEPTLKAALKEQAIRLIGHGVTHFYCGGALGFDTLAAACILELKKQNSDIRLLLALPCRGQEKYYNKYTKDKLGRAAVCLPSTSPANAAWSIERLVGAWRIINE